MTSQPTADSTAIEAIRPAMASIQLPSPDGLTPDNPRTGEPKPVPAKRLPFFKVGKDLKEIVNGSRHLAITGGDDKAILQECERGEDAAKTAYQKALKEDVPPYVHDIIERQYKGVVENHDVIKQLRDAA